MSDYLNDVRLAVTAALELTKNAILEAAAVNDFDAVRALGTIAKRLDRVLEDGREEVTSSEGVPSSTDKRSGRSAVARTRPAAKDPHGAAQGSPYPRFHRDSLRLTKVGWSKRDKTEYEHKAPKRAISAVAAAIQNIDGDVFSVEHLLPIKEADGSDIPSYQVYLVINWLRQIGAVRRHGNDGYTCDPSLLTDRNLQAEWLKLPEPK
jgi:hypothetical protein